MLSRRRVHAYGLFGLGIDENDWNAGQLVCRLNRCATARRPRAYLNRRTDSAFGVLYVAFAAAGSSLPSHLSSKGTTRASDQRRSSS